jgi:hypothetical protein
LYIRVNLGTALVAEHEISLTWAATGMIAFGCGAWVAPGVRTASWLRGDGCGVPAGAPRDKGGPGQSASRGVTRVPV